MNDFQIKLYNELTHLVETNEAFYAQDFELQERWYRIFNYRLASYTDFMAPSALECRGVMFEIEKSGSPEIVTVLRLAAMPMEKFFNLNENPMTMGLDLSTINLIEEKADGSLISTYVHCAYGQEGTLALKSKGSVTSDQCVAAMRWLTERFEFWRQLKLLTVAGWTVNLEWVSPENRIVLGYEQPALRVLNIRSNLDGRYMDKAEMSADLDGPYSKIHRYWVDQIVVLNTVGEESAVAVAGELKVLNLKKFVDAIPDMEGIEGFVVRLSTGQKVKIKTKWYLALHHTKDSINSDRRLFEAVLAEATDDLRSLFFDDKVAIARIEMMEKYVDERYNHLVNMVEQFYETNKELDRKGYAILGQQQLDRHQFGLAMKKFLGQPIDYKAYMAAKWKEFGIKDDPVEVADTHTLTVDIEARSE